MEIKALTTNPLNQNNYHKNCKTPEYIGSLIIYPINYNHENCLPCNGYKLKIIDYSLLHSVIGSSFNDGTEQPDEFRIPDYNITGRFLQPSSTPTKVLEAGLPNITGVIYQDGINATSNNGLIWNASGCLYLASTTTSVATYNPSGTNRAVKHVDLDASRSSSIYGNSTTVQPSSQGVQVCIRYK